MSNDNNLRYGLEKVTGEYDVDAYSKMIAKLKSGPNNTEIPDLLANNETQENCTRIRISKIESVTQPVKGFRRSIDEKEFPENEEYVPIALLMKIKHLDGQPGIQFKIVSDNPNNQRIHNLFKSSGNEIPFINSLSKINFETDSAKNSIKSASIAVEKNGTLILNIFANAIDLVRENDTVPYTFVDEDIGNENVSDTPRANIYHKNDTFITNSVYLNWQTEIESSMNNTASPNTYTYNVLNNNFTGVNISVTQNSINKTFTTDFFAIDNRKIGIITDVIQQETSGSIFREENEIVTRKFENESVSVADLEMESTIATENVDAVFISDEFNNSSNLVGFLIQETTANLSID